MALYSEPRWRRRVRLFTGLLFAVSSVGAQSLQHPLLGKGSPPPSILWNDRDTKDIENFIEDKMKEWHAPGMAVAVVDGNSTWMKGFGLSREGYGPTTPKTLFFGGSTTKGFTAAALSQLVDDEEKHPDVQWNASVSSLLPDDFVLSDPWSTQHITVEDCLSHRTGYPAHDFVAWPDAGAAARGLRHLPMSAEPRTRFQYNNQMFTAMGYLVERLSGGKWLGDVLRNKVWHPMGMKNTFLSVDDAKRNRGSLADELWYHNDSDSYVVVPHVPHPGHEGAGMIISCVEDYAKYLGYMMDEPADGPISKAGYAALKAPHMIYDAGSNPQFTGPTYYGFGWLSGVMEGEQFWCHSGQMREHITHVWFFPQRKFGVVLMQNADSPAIEIALWRIIYDYLGVKEERRLDVEKGAKDRIKASETRLQNTIPRLYPTVPDPPLPRPLALDKYAGSYQNEGYGNLTIALECGDDAGDEKKFEAETPAHPTVEKGCFLQGNGTMEFEGKTFHLRFEHVTGDYWVGWLYVDQHVPKPKGKKDKDKEKYVVRPRLGLRAQFEVGSEGVPVRFGGDFRREGEDGPLVWYDMLGNDDSGPGEL